MATREQYAKWIVDNQGNYGTPEFDVVAKAYKQQFGSDMPTVTDPAREEAQATSDKGVVDFNTFFMGTPAGRVMQGAADLPLGAAQYISESLGGEGDNALTTALKRREGMIEGGREAVGSEGVDWSRMLGNVMQGGAVTKGVPLAATLPGKVAQGAGLGAIFGASTPATSNDIDSEKGSQIALGAAAGAAMPPLLAAGKFGGQKIAQALDIMAPGGAKSNAQRALIDALGDRRPEAARLLEQNNSPLGVGNAGQVASPAGSAEFSALQKVASNRNPSQAVADTRAMNQARVEALRSFAGTPDDLANATRFRSGNASPIYEEAWNTPLQMTDEFAQLLDDPFIKSVLPSVDDVAASQSIEQGTTQYYHLVKKALDGMLTPTVKEGGLDPFKRSAIESARGKFVEQLGKSNPLYERARAQFANDSPPVNQMQVGQQLIDALKNPVRENAGSRATTFANAVENAPRTIKRATGQGIYDDLSKVLTPEQMRQVGNVQDDLMRSSSYEELAKAGTKAASDLATNMGNVPQVKILERGFVVANAVLSRLGKKSTEATLDYLEMVMRDPQKTAQLLKEASPGEMEAMSLIMDIARSAPSIVAAGEQ